MIVTLHNWFKEGSKISVRLPEKSSIVIPKDYFQFNLGEGTLSITAHWEDIQQYLYGIMPKDLDCYFEYDGREFVFTPIIFRDVQFSDEFYPAITGTLAYREGRVKNVEKKEPDNGK